MAKSKICWFAAGVAACVVFSAQARASPSPLEMLQQMDPAAPKYSAPLCTEVREAATRPAGVGGTTVVYHGPINMPAGAAYAFGAFAIIMAVEAAREAERRDAVFAEILIERCGEDAFIPYFRARAEKGDDDAAAWLGRAYVHKQDWPQAVHWFQAGAARKNAAAEAGLGALFAQGNGVPRDRAQAAVMWQRAADHGSVNARADLGQMYAQDQDYPKAIEWYRGAAERGHTVAAFQLAQLYEQGLGVARSDRSAFAWYSMASIGGHAEATERRTAVAARMKPGEISDQAKKVERCYFKKRCNF